MLSYILYINPYLHLRPESRIYKISFFFSLSVIFCGLILVGRYVLCIVLVVVLVVVIIETVIWI